VGDLNQEAMQLVLKIELVVWNDRKHEIGRQSLAPKLTLHRRPPHKSRQPFIFGTKAALVVARASEVKILFAI
jgi:hypothetical protein